MKCCIFVFIFFHVCFLGDYFNPVALAVSDYVLEEEARDYVDSIHIEEDPVDKYSLPEQQHQYSLPEQQLQEDHETEIVVDEAPAEEISASLQSVVNTVHEAPAVAVEEPVGEPLKKTYASIVCTCSVTLECVCGGWWWVVYTCATLFSFSNVLLHCCFAIMSQDVFVSCKCLWICYFSFIEGLCEFGLLMFVCSSYT